MAKRTYGQYCALARAFDVLGERWTPLLLRELAIGPRRYADLLEGLPGVSPSLLTQRLRELEEDGIVRRSYLPPRAAPRPPSAVCASSPRRRSHRRLEGSSSRHDLLASRLVSGLRDLG